MIDNVEFGWEERDELLLGHAGRGGGGGREEVAEPFLRTFGKEVCDFDDIEVMIERED